MKLLTAAHQNAKTAKNKKHDKYLSAILHLAPSNLSGYNTCPAASKGCSMACLNTAGRGRFNNVQQARIRKTKLFYQDQSTFFKLLIGDINSLVSKAKAKKKIPVVRLNGTSDIDFENIKVLNGLSIFQMFPMVQFYDYTKRIMRLNKVLPSNYHLTFSLAENNQRAAAIALQKGFNVAVVFKDIPKEYMIRDIKTQVLNGDEHDLRFLEGNQGVVIGLKAKGKAKQDTSGFVR